MAFVGCANNAQGNTPKAKTLADFGITPFTTSKDYAGANNEGMYNVAYKGGEGTATDPVKVEITVKSDDENLKTDKDIHNCLHLGLDTNESKSKAVTGFFIDLKKINKDATYAVAVLSLEAQTKINLGDQTNNDKSIDLNEKASLVFDVTDPTSSVVEGNKLGKDKSVKVAIVAEKDEITTPTEESKVLFLEVSLKDVKE